MVPADNPETYLSHFRDQAQECFADTLYEDAAAGDMDAFNYEVDDPDAPHAPFHILFHSDLVALDPVRSPDWHSQPLVQASFADFLECTSDLIDEETT